MEGDAHRISAKALHNRGYLVVKGHGSNWNATTTPSGQELVDRRSDPADAPLSDTAGVIPQDVIAAGGERRTSDNRDREADKRLLRRALSSPARPYGQKPARERLCEWYSDEGRWYLTLHFPDYVEAGPVLVADKVGRFHAVVAHFRDDRDSQRVTREGVPRVAWIPQGLVAEAERRGNRVRVVQTANSTAWSRPDPVFGQLAIPIGANEYPIEMQEIPGVGAKRLPDDRSRLAKMPLWRSARQYEFIPIGKLQLTLESRRLGDWPTEFKDRRATRLEDLLLEVMRELEIRQLEDDWDREETARIAAAKRAEWEKAMAAAEIKPQQAHRASILKDQATRWQEAELLAR